MLSFWEKKHFTNYDFIIAGAGILGLSVAAEILENKPSAKVLVLERGFFPSGASTKNAGFACFGSLTEILSDIKRIGENKTKELVSKRWQGISLLRNRLGDDNLGFLNLGGYELLDSKSLHATDELGYVNFLLHEIFELNTFYIRHDLTNEFGFNPEFVKELVYSPFESQIDTGKMMSSLIKYVQEKGASILTGAEVENYSDTGSNVSVFTKNPFSDELIEFKSGNFILCTNAFTSSLVKDFDIKPGRGQVVVTKPIDGLKFKGIFHYDEGFYYFRNFGDRVILGGGRNLDFDGETSLEFTANEMILNDLSNKLRTVILLDTEFEIDYNWTGIMGFTSDKLPKVDRISNNVTASICCNGMGVALASFIAKEIFISIDK